MASENNTTGASAQAVDAYKTYLFRNGNRKVSQIEAIKLGQIIPLDDLEHDIAITQKTIQTVEKFGLPADEEKTRLSGLLNLKAALLNKPSPLLKHKAKVKQQNDASLTYQVTTGIKKNPILVVKAPKQPVKKEVTLNAAGAKFSQEFLMQMGMLSNCNVLIYATMGTHSKFGETLALRCKHCGLDKHIEDTLSMVESRSLGPEVGEFCKAHRHEPGAAPAQTAPSGRMFRDED